MFTDQLTLLEKADTTFDLIAPSRDSYVCNTSIIGKTDLLQTTFSAPVCYLTIVQRVKLSRVFNCQFEYTFIGPITHFYLST